MRFLSSAFLLSQITLVGIAVIAVPRSASAQLNIDCVTTVVANACVAPGNHPPIRRGVTETITIRGPFVNQTDLAGVTTGNSAVTVSKVVGSSCGAVGCLAVTLNTRADFTLGARLVPIFVKNLFGTTAFNVMIVRRGEITSLSHIPTNPIWGEPVAVTISGIDIGNARASVERSAVSNMAPGTSSATTFTVIASGPAQSITAVTVGDKDISGAFGNYRFTSVKRTIDYRAATGQASCVTTPGIIAPMLLAPANQQIFTFVDNPVQANITLRWRETDFKSTERFIVEIGPLNGVVTSSTTAEGAATKTVSLPRNQSFRWRVKAFNCGEPAPFSSFSTFEVR